MTIQTPSARRAAIALVALLVAVLATAAAAAPARAAFAVESFSVTLSDTRAGAHADVTTAFAMEADPLTLLPDKRVRNTKIDLPVGLLGNPNNVPKCSRAAWRTRSCPPETQVGEGLFTLVLPGVEIPFPAAVYNLVPSGDAPALFGADMIVATQLIRITVRGDDYGLTAHVDEATSPAGAALAGAELTLWGVPADHGTGAPRKPFMSNPTTCDAPLVSRLAVDSYETPDEVVTATATQPAMTDCGALPFDPSLSVLAENRVDAPSRLQVDVGVAQNEDPAGRASAHLRDAVVTLPEGMSINPAMAAGLNACTDLQFAARQSGAPSCPSESAIGTAGIDVPLLEQRVAGRIYVGEPKPGDPYRLLVHGSGSGVHVKLVGSIRTDPRTGRMTAVFEGNPQQPFTRLSLTFRGGPLAPVATPTTCGVKAVTAGFTPYGGGPTVDREAGLTFMGAGANPDCAAPAPFAPRFTAGTVGRDAGSDAGFVVAFSREDGERALGALRMSLPAGLLGRLTAVPPCAAADATAGRCSDASLVGDASVSVGAGSSPLTLRNGRVHLTTPYEPGDVAGLAIVVPAKVGPYDLGTVVVRSRLRMRPDTGLEVVSDPVPTILQGIPLRIRQVVVDLGRPGFMFNPTDCSPKAIGATVVAADGTEVERSTPFEVSGCATKPFAPRTVVATTAPKRDGGTAGLRVELGTGGGESNVRSVELTLPNRLSARLQGPVGTPCSAEDWQADRCAPSARIGGAEARTDVLPEPLAGSAFFVANPGGALPRIGIRLKGAVTLDVMGEVTLGADGRIRTVFPSVPDVPLQQFALTLDGGENAVLAGTRLCGGTLRADRVIRSHSGHEVRDRVPVAVAGCPARAASKAKGKGAKAKQAKAKGKRGKAKRAGRA